MVRNFLATTALATVLATGAHAQTAPAPAAQPTPAQTDAGVDHAGHGEVSFEYLTALQTGQYLSNDLVGLDIYASATEDADDIGDIENLVIDADGTVAAVLLETDSSLGANSHVVAVPFDRFEWTHEADGDLRAILAVPAEELVAAQAFNADADATAVQAGTQDRIVEDGDYLATLGEGQYLSDDLVGDAVYTGATTESDNIGTINNLVIASEGTVEALVVGVGGFLGIGEKDVAVPFGAVALTYDEDGEQHVALAVNRESLDAAPEFDDERPYATAQRTDATAPAGTAPAGTAPAGTAPAATAPAGTATAPAGTATAPAATVATAPAGQTTAAGTAGLVPAGELTADNLIGTTVYGPGEESIGNVGDIALTDDGQVEAIIIDVGGFLGIGAKPVAVSLENLEVLRDASGSLEVTTQFTQEQLEAAPEFDSETYAQNRDTMLLENPAAAQ